MSKRTYMMVDTPPGQLGTTISDIEGEHRTPVLWLPQGTPPETLHDATTALQRALQQGREDRSTEILTDGISRAAAEVDKHEAELHYAGLYCSCGHYYDPDGDGDKWNVHLAAAILQAAGQE